MEFTPLACRMAHYASRCPGLEPSSSARTDYLGLASLSCRGKAGKSYRAAGSLITKWGGGGQKLHLG